MKQFNFKYTTDPFISFAKVIHPEDDSISLALASLDSLKDLMPGNINHDQNPDVVFNSFNAAVVGRANRNDDVIDNISAVRIYKNFIHKFCDIEHRRDIVVGAIINAGFSSFGDNRIITEEEVLNSVDPVNICLSAVVWRVLNEDFADKLIESADETSILYHSISTSWELGFDSYQIVLGHKDLSKGELITDKKQIQEFSKYLRANRGEGKTKDNVPVYRKIIGDMYPLAIGYVRNPAAEVKGVIISSQEITPAQQEEIVVNLQSNNLVTCAGCNKSFNYNNEPEKSMGSVECPNCKCKLSQEGKVLVSAALPAKENYIEIDILKNICELSEDQAVASLQSALECFTSKNLDSTNILNRLNNIDNNFKVSAKDLTKALHLVQQSGKDAEISIADLTNSIKEFNKNNDLHKNISLSEKNSVNKVTSLSNIEKKYKRMKLKFNDSDKEVLETAAATDVYEVAVELNKKMSEFAEQRDAKELEAKAALDKYNQVQSSYDAITKELADVKDQLNKLNEVRAQEKIQNDFNIRMSDLNEKFELDGDKSKAIANQIRGLDDTSYSSWLESFKPFLIAKKAKAEVEKEDSGEDDKEDMKESMCKDKKGECKASLLEEIEKLKPEDKKIVNKSSGHKSIADLVNEAFAGVGEDK